MRCARCAPHVLLGRMPSCVCCVVSVPCMPCTAAAKTYDEGVAPLLVLGHCNGNQALVKALGNATSAPQLLQRCTCVSMGSWYMWSASSATRRTRKRPHGVLVIVVALAVVLAVEVVLAAALGSLGVAVLGVQVGCRQVGAVVEQRLVPCGQQLLQRVCGMWYRACVTVCRYTGTHQCKGGGRCETQSAACRAR